MTDEPRFPRLLRLHLALNRQPWQTVTTLAYGLAIGACLTARPGSVLMWALAAALVGLEVRGAVRQRRDYLAMVRSARANAEAMMQLVDDPLTRRAAADADTLKDGGPP